MQPMILADRTARAAINKEKPLPPFNVLAGLDALVRAATKRSGVYPRRPSMCVAINTGKCSTTSTCAKKTP